MNLKLEFEFNKTDIIKDVDALKKQVDALRPLPADVEGKIMQKLRLDWNYHSNAIEGNRLNYGETVAFLMEGITAKGKPLKDHLDIRGHNDAINFLLEIVKDSRPISEADIRALHKMILVEPYDSPAKTAEGLSTTKRITLGEYKTSPNHVKTSTGEIHYYASPEETPAKMHELMDWYEEVGRYDINPIIIAALFHHKFVAIHPFDDGNGRLSRILMNLILMQSGYPPVVVKTDDRKNYYSLLSRADIGENWPFVEYIAELMQSSFQLYIKAAAGGDIDEDEDIDKEIALYKMELEAAINVKQRRSNVLINNVFALSMKPLIDKLNSKIQTFADLFFEYSHAIVFQLNNNDFVRYDSIDHFVNTTTGISQEVLIQELQVMAIEFNFENFKNSNNDFNIGICTVVKFDEYNYEFFDVNNKSILKKLYHENVSAIEQKIVLKALVQNFKDEMNIKQQSPKP